MIFVLDNYDSFTYNLVHLAGKFTNDIVVYRNDTISVEEVKRLKPNGIIISPGPGRPDLREPDRTGPATGSARRATGGPTSAT